MSTSLLHPSSSHAIDPIPEATMAGVEIRHPDGKAITSQRPVQLEVNDIRYVVYKPNLIGGGLAMCEGIEARFPSVDEQNGVILYPKDTSDRYFVLRFDAIDKRDNYRDYVFDIGEGERLGNVCIPEILAEYSIKGIPYLLIAVQPRLDEGTIPLSIDELAAINRDLKAKVNDALATSQKL